MKLWNKLNRFNWFRNKKFPEEHKMEGKVLELDFNPPEPSNIKWENMDIKEGESNKRMLFVYFILFLTVFISFMALTL